MKKGFIKSFTFTLAILFILSMFQAGIVSAATQPSMSMSSKTVIGTGMIFTLNIKNAGKNVKRMTWYTLDENIATVESTKDAATGTVTSVGKGITYIKCKITYTNGKVIRKACKVTVKIPPTSVSINNAQDTVNNRHVIEVGDSYDFNATLNPSNTNAKVYWSIEDNGKGYATVDSNGVVTGVKTDDGNGAFVVLKAAASLTQSGAATSTVYDNINIEIVNKSANVLNVELTDSTKITVTFDKAINPSTVIGENGKLLNTVTLMSTVNTDGTTSATLGNLTGTLSTDGKKLTIQSVNSFNGSYVISLSSGIKTTDNIPLSSYSKTITLIDTAKPYYNGFTVDVTGLIVTLNFNEPMDFTNMAISGAKAANSSQTADATTIGMLNTKSNYVVSEDKKSLKINLSAIPVSDRNKLFSVILSGVKDLSGNYPNPNPMILTFQTDTSYKTQAQLVSIVRSGYKTLTATFTREIKTAGYVILTNGETIQGAVDPTDAKKVNYTLSNASVLLTGVQDVSVGGWDSYNVSPTDTTASGLTRRSVNFTLDSSKPIITKSELVIETQNNVDIYELVLTFSENVTLTSDTGILSAKLVTATNDIYSSKILSYSGIAKDNKVTLILNKDQISDNGVYTITLPVGMVRDPYNNANDTTTVQVTKNASVSSVLPAPKGIVQAADNPNILYVYFEKKLDEATAQYVPNYQLVGTGVTVKSAELIDNTVNGATVKLTLNSGCLAATTLYPITISGIKGYQDSYSVMDKYQTVMLLNENKAPQVVSTKYTAPSTIIITFDENIKGSASFQAIQNNTDLYSTAVINNNTITIVLKQAPTINSVIYLVPTSNTTLTDTSGNTVSLSPTYVSTAIQ